MNDCLYRISVKALITDESGRFLLARESDGTWDMLGGGLEHNEDPINELRREIQEETGLKVTDIQSAPKYFVTAYKPAKDVYIANIMYETQIKNLEFTPSDECEELRYVTIDEARKLNLLPNIEKFLEVLEQHQ